MVAWEVRGFAVAQAEPSSEVEDGTPQEVPSKTSRSQLVVTVAFVAVVVLAGFILGLVVARVQASGTDKSLSYQAPHQKRFSYGLEACECPGNNPDKSEEGFVTLGNVKRALGAEESDEVKFWWVYPSITKGEPRERLGPVRDQFRDFGGFQYKWGQHITCFAFTPTGDHLILETSSYIPEVTDWHEVTIVSPMTHFSWIPPTKEEGKCEDGCFVYITDGRTTALTVVAVKEDSPD